MKIKRILSCVLYVMVVSLCAESVLAHSKVVVVPLSGAATKSSGSEWIKIFDNKNVFFGYALGDNMIISVEQYFTFTPRRSYSGDVEHYGTSGSIIYLSTDCSGTPYVDSHYYPKGPFSGPGRVIGRSYDYTTYYIPKSATPVAIPANTDQSYYDYNATCSTNLQSAESVYEILPNDPNITGFPNTISGPLKAVYTLP